MRTCLRYGKINHKPHLIQEYIGASTGKDVRIIVIGGKAAGGMLRKSETNFRSNIGAGGTAEPYALTEEMQVLAEKTAKTLGLDYCGIDVLFDENSPIICKVNSNAFFLYIRKDNGHQRHRIIRRTYINNIKIKN